MSNKLETLLEYLQQCSSGGICLAFSGGVDSALLLRALSLLPIRAEAVTFRTSLHPARDAEEARNLATQFGVQHTVLDVDEFSDERIMQNPVDRCYLCKRLLFQKLAEYAQKNGLAVMIDGTNADDLKEYRPGLRALREYGVVSPLAELGMSKSEVRALAKELSLPVYAKPAAPCLATRLPYGTRITRPLLVKIEKAERFLKELGFDTVRVRVHGDIARIEVPQDFLKRLLMRRTEIIESLTGLGFDYVTLDLQGFSSGSMDKQIQRSDTE